MTDDLKIDTEGIFENDPPELSPKAKQVAGFVKEVMGEVFPFRQGTPQIKAKSESYVSSVPRGVIESALQELLDNGWNLQCPPVPLQDGTILIVLGKITYEELSSDEKQDTMRG